MLRVLTIIFALAGMVLSGHASSEPIKLKRSYFNSGRTMFYLRGVMSFMDAVNAKAKGLLEIKFTLVAR